MNLAEVAGHGSGVVTEKVQSENMSHDINILLVKIFRKWLPFLSLSGCHFRLSRMGKKLACLGCIFGCCLDCLSFSSQKQEQEQKYTTP